VDPKSGSALLGNNLGNKLSETQEHSEAENPAKHGLYHLSDTPSLRLGAGRSQVQILSPRPFCRRSNRPSPPGGWVFGVPGPRRPRPSVDRGAAGCSANLEGGGDLAERLTSFASAPVRSRPDSRLTMATHARRHCAMRGLAVFATSRLLGVVVSCPGTRQTFMEKLEL
jgi:hypothetical protein